MRFLMHHSVICTGATFTCLCSKGLLGDLTWDGKKGEFLTHCLTCKRVVRVAPTGKK